MSGFAEAWWRRAARTALATRGARAAVSVIVVVVVLALLAPVVLRYAPTEQLDIVGLRTQPPSWSHPMGTDDYSRDVLSRVLHGARMSLGVATLAVVLASTLGMAYGLVAGFAGGRVDAVLMRLLDALLSIPRVILLVAILALWSPVPPLALVLALGVTGWFGVSRLVRAEVLSLRERDFVAAARALGASPARLVVRHLAPHVAAPVVVAATLGVGHVIALEAGLSYLGIGVREPHPSWGSILRAGTETFAEAWWLVVFPGAVMVVTVVAFNVLGDALRDALDPRQLPRGRTPDGADVTVETS